MKELREIKTRDAHCFLGSARLRCLLSVFSIVFRLCSNYISSPSQWQLLSRRSVFCLKIVFFFLVTDLSWANSSGMALLNFSSPALLLFQQSRPHVRRMAQSMPGWPLSRFSTALNPLFVPSPASSLQQAGLFTAHEHANQPLVWTMWSQNWLSWGFKHWKWSRWFCCYLY